MIIVNINRTKNAKDLLSKIKPYIWGVRLTDFIDEEGKSIIDTLRYYNYRVYADIKLRDDLETSTLRLKPYTESCTEFISIYVDNHYNVLRGLKAQSNISKIIGIPIVPGLTDQICQNLYRTDLYSLKVGFINMLYSAELDGIEFELEDANIVQYIENIRKVNIVKILRSSYEEIMDNIDRINKYSNIQYFLINETDENKIKILFTQLENKI